MVENIGAVRDVQIERVKPPEPQTQTQRPAAQGNSGEGDYTPPNGVALLAHGSTAALLSMQEAQGQTQDKTAATAAAEAKTTGDKVLAREELQKLFDKATTDRAALSKADDTRQANSRAANAAEDTKAEADAKTSAKDAAALEASRTEAQRKEAQRVEANRQEALRNQPSPTGETTPAKSSYTRAINIGA